MSDSRTIGLLLDPQDRETLLARFTPAWPDVIAHHLTRAAHTRDPERGRKPMQSNDVLRERGWDTIGPPVPVRLIPAELP